MPKLPSADFLRRLADIADRETLPRFRTDLAVDSKTGEGYFDPVTYLPVRAPKSALLPTLGFPTSTMDGRRSSAEAGTGAGAAECMDRDYRPGRHPL